MECKNKPGIVEEKQNRKYIILDHSKLSISDMLKIAEYNKVVLNYIKMKRIEDEN